jgi:predicted RND superfamily exporter protein
MNDTTYLPETPAPSANGVRIVHLVFGILFLGVAVIWALGVNDVLRFDVSLAVVLPVVLIVAGAAGLVAMLANAARGRRTNRAGEPAAEGNYLDD